MLDKKNEKISYSMNIFIKYYKVLINFFIFLILMLIKINDNSLNNKMFIKIFPKSNFNFKNQKLSNIFKSRELFINDEHINIEYVKLIREIIEKKNIVKNTNKRKIIYKFNEHYFKKRKNKLNFTEFGKLCLEEKLIDNRKFRAYNKPLITKFFHLLIKEKYF